MSRSDSTDDIGTNDPDSISEVVLMRMSATRIGWNTGQRLAHTIYS